MNEEKVPKVSVVCAWYNRADYIKDTVESLLNQDFDDYEIIIANDGSPDPRVKEILDSYDDPKLTVIHKENEGFTKTIKMLVDMAKAPYVAIQGAGEVSYANRITEQYKFLINNVDYCLVGCSSASVIKRNGEPDVVLQNNSVQHGDVKVDTQRRGLPFTHGSLMFSKQIYDSCGGYREIFKYAQDYDLFMRLSQSGKCFSMDKILYQRNIFSDGVSTNPEKSFEQAMFVKIANRCYDHKRLYGFDPIDRHAEFYFMLYSFDVKDTLALYKVVVKAAYLKQYEKSKFFVEAFGGRIQKPILQLLVEILERNKLVRSLFDKLVERFFNSTVFIKSND